MRTLVTTAQIVPHAQEFSAKHPPAATAAFNDAFAAAFAAASAFFTAPIAAIIVTLGDPAELQDENKSAGIKWIPDGNRRAPTPASQHTFFPKKSTLQSPQRLLLLKLVMMLIPLTLTVFPFVPTDTQTFHTIC